MTSLKPSSTAQQRNQNFSEEIKDKKELQSFLGIVNYAAAHYSPEVTKIRKYIDKQILQE